MILVLQNILFCRLDIFSLFSVCGESDVLEILINSGGDPNTPDIHQAYPIHYAAQMCGPNSEMGNETKVGLQILRKLISLGVNVNVTDHEDRQPLTWAAGSGSSDAILRYGHLQTWPLEPEGEPVFSHWACEILQF